MARERIDACRWKLEPWLGRGAAQPPIARVKANEVLEQERGEREMLILGYQV